MGAMVAMLAAARAPGAVRSLVLVEPAAFDLVRGRADAEAFIAGYDALRAGASDAEQFLREFLVLFGADPGEVAQVPDPMLASGRALVLAAPTRGAASPTSWSGPRPGRSGCDRVCPG